MRVLFVKSDSGTGKKKQRPVVTTSALGTRISFRVYERRDFFVRLVPCGGVDSHPESKG